MTGKRNMEGGTLSEGLPVEGTSFPSGFMTFEMVEERLVEAMLTCWRQPDRERAWSRGASDGPWHLAMPEPGDWAGGGVDGLKALLKPASLTRIEVAEMEEAFGWVEALVPADRKLVGVVISELAAGKRQVSWSRVMRRLGLERGRDGVRVRYGRAIASIAAAKNGGNPRGMLVKG